MPIHKNPYNKGRLFIYFKVKFPTKLDKASVALLHKALPGPYAPKGKPVEVPKDAIEPENDLQDIEPEEFGQVGYSAAHGNAYDSDEEQGRGGGPGGQNVQCANQ